MFRNKLELKELFSFSSDIKPSYFILSIGLIPLNWWLESVRWYLLGKEHFHISLKNVFKGTLQSVAFSFFLGRIIGDILGKGKYLNKNIERLKTTGTSFVCNALMSVPTLSIGAIATYLYFDTWTTHFTIITALLIGILLFVIFISQKKIKAFQKLDVLFQYSPTALGLNLLCSFLRYIVFSLQYLCVFYFLGIHTSPFVLMIGIALVFVSKSFIPTLNALGDLGIREISANLFFSKYGIEATIIFQATFMIWLLNIFTPALIGLIIFLREELKRKKTVQKS